jgi:membrane protein DedA with SNARE-associated domain
MGKRALVLGVLLLAALACGLGWLSTGSALVERELAALGAAEPFEGPALLAACAVLAAATLVSEDLTCIGAGALVAQGKLAFLPVAAACFAGIFLGDLLLFLCGRWLGRRALAAPPCAWFLERERVDEAARWLERRGGVVIFAARFLPGARLPTYFASGALGTHLGRFSLWFALAGILWTPAVVALAAGLGGGLARLELLRGSGAWALAGTLVLGWAGIALARALATWRGRALLRARLRRIARFEYWPIGVFYLPVFALFLLRALRGRALVFTAANPALPHGGFVGESKRAIYALLEHARAPLPRMCFLARAESAGSRRAAVRRLQLGLASDFPLVVKPDAGQRGEGVRIVRDVGALEHALAADEDLVVQEFVPGEEYGLFYARSPGAERGELFSLTRKVLPAVQGDGRSTLERLILADREHLPMAPLFLARPAAELARVPAAGERVLLGELGTHCRGARFLDGSALASPALSDALERIARALPGFHLGRFDVRAASAEELAAGRFRILELNGVTSEAAHVYDPRFGLLAAWRSLLGQWRRAYAIGAANARGGARVSSLGELLASLRAYRALAVQRERTLAPRSGRGTAPRVLVETRP